ncbi:MAG TPA: hypothetical protein VHG28_03525 [Longimicrobiaceae bacterium]|nr:hypothetical protein [Longimicrobiaceae bacterium]
MRWGSPTTPPRSFLARHERSARIYDRPDEVHRFVVARQVLRGYRVEPCAPAPELGYEHRPGDRGRIDRLAG